MREGAARSVPFLSFRAPSGEPGRDMNSMGGPVHVVAGRVDALVVKVWERVGLQIRDGAVLFHIC